MQELIELSRAGAAQLAAEFRGDPRAELTAWLHIALQREGLVASLYDRHTVEARLRAVSGHLARSTLAKLNGICANEEMHVAIIRAILAAECPWPQMAVEEGWGRLQGLVLGQLAGTNALVRGIALILLEIGARSPRERAAGRAVAGLDVGGFLKFSRGLEVTAVESYQRVAALLAALHRREREQPGGLAVHLKILCILRDERVHRDVLHVLYRAFAGNAVPPRDSDEAATDLPASIAARPISSRTELNQVCRAILTFHYGAALPADASPEEVLPTAVDYWRWQMENPLRKSYMVERQGRDALCRGEHVLLLGTAGLQHVVRGISSIRSRRFDRRLISRFIADSQSRQQRVRRVTSRPYKRLGRNSVAEVRLSDRRTAVPCGAKEALPSH